MTTKELQKNNSQRDLEGKVAIVTGAASGIGRATALLFETRGAQVIAEDINPAVNELIRSGEHILPFVGDVASEESAKQVVALAIERFGKLDILVNNAATIKYTRVLDLTLEEQHSLRESHWRLPPFPRGGTRNDSEKERSDCEYRIVRLLLWFPSDWSICRFQRRTRATNPRARSGEHPAWHSCQRCRSWRRRNKLVESLHAKRTRVSRTARKERAHRPRRTTGGDRGSSGIPGF
jgi:hypothetical protein